MSRRWKEILISSGTLVAIMGVVVALLASSPSAWKASLEGWRKAFWQEFWPIGVYVVAALAAGYLTGDFFRRRRVRDGAKLLDDEEYRKQFRECLKERKVIRVKIFGYTGEVVTNDLIEYGDRYRPELEVRLLQRNWIVEQTDEIAHNQRPEVRGLRKWNKSQAIKNMALEAWPYSMKRNIRYYDHHPILKGAILSSSDDEEIVAFIGLLKWDPLPANGGSVFKSVPGHVLMIRSSDGQSARDMIKRIQSQFDYDWLHGLTADELVSQEG